MPPPAKTATQKKAAEARRKIVYNTTKEVAKREEESQFARTFKAPEGTKVFKFKAAKRYKLRAIPHIVGNTNPRCDEGLVHYELTFYTHPQLGPKNETVVCGQCFKDEEGNTKPCAVCDHQQALRRAGASWDDTKHLAPKRRQLWYFEDQDDLPAGIQVFEASYFGKGQGFGEMIQNKLDVSDEDSPRHNFFHLNGGSTITVLTKEDKYQGRVFYKPVSLEMDLSKKVYDESILDKLVPLESLLVETPYDKVEAMLGGGAPPEEGESESAEAAEEPAEEEETETEVEEEPAEEEETEAEVEEEPAEEEETEAEVEEEPAEEEAQEVEIGVGSRVQYEVNGKPRTGTVSKILEDKQVLHVKIDGKDGPPVVVKMDEPTLAVLEEEEPAEEEIEVEEEEVEIEEEEVPEPPKKKTPPKAATKPAPKKAAGKK